MFPPLTHTNYFIPAQYYLDSETQQDDLILQDPQGDAAYIIMYHQYSPSVHSVMTIRLESRPPCTSFDLPQENYSCLFGIL